MHHLGYLDGIRAREIQDDVDEVRNEEAPAVGKRPRSALREALYRHAVAGATPDRLRAARAAELIAAAIGGGGSALPPDVRRRLEAMLRADLSALRVHTGSAANDAADAVGARAFAIGDAMVFADGAYAPGTIEGDWLLAHEATHAARHRGAPGVADDPVAEAEASAIGDAYARDHACTAACAHPPRGAPLDDAIRQAVERTTGVAVGDVTVERGAELGPGRLGEAEGSTIRLAPEASGDDALGKRVRFHEAVHVAQGRICDHHGSVPADRTAAVEAEAHAATEAAERGEQQPLGVKADPGQRYGFDLGDVARALGIDPMQFLRDHFPQVAAFFQRGFGPLVQQLGDLAGAAVQGVLDRLGVGDLQAAFDAITGSFRPGGMAFGILHGCCECLEHALHDLMQSVQGVLHSGAAQRVQRWIAEAQEVENNRILDEVTDFFAALRMFGGPILAGIEQVSRWIHQADAAIGRSVIWRALAPLFGLDGSLSPIEAIKHKMSQMWEAARRGVEAIKRGLAALWAQIRANRIVAAILRLSNDCGRLVTAIRHVREARSRDPRVWLGILARDLQGTVFEGLVSALQSGYQTVVDLKNQAVAWLVGILDATGLLAVFNAAVPFLNVIGRAIQRLAHRIQATVQRIRAAIEHALDEAAKALRDLWHTIEPYISFVVGLGVAIWATAGGDIMAIPRFVVGQLWLHVLPPCYKEALCTFLLDLFIELVEWFPARHPVMILLRSAALSFLHTVQAAPMPRKIGAMDTIARIMSNDVEVVAGFFVGVVEGLWNSSLGFLVQLAIMPFTMAWDVLSTIGRQVAALAGRAFGDVFRGASWLVNTMANAHEVHPGAATAAGAGAGGTADPSAPGSASTAPSPGGPQTVTTPVTVDPSSEPTSTDGADTPDSEVVSGPSSSDPHGPTTSSTPAAPAGPDAPAAEGAESTFEDPPPFPALPPLGELIDPMFRRGVSREQVEEMFRRLNIAMDQWGTQFGRDGANRILPYLNSGSAPYDVGHIVGEVVGWLAGEIIMLVATDGIENAIAKALEGVMDGARILARIGEYFPRLLEWIGEMRRLIAPLVEAVEHIAARAREFLQRIMQWLEEMMAWVRRQWERVLRWAEETFGEAGRALRRLLGGAAELEAEAEAIEAANYAFERLDVQLLNEAVPFNVIESRLHTIAVPHTPDVQIHLHLVTTTHWRIEATAIKGSHRGIGLSIGRGAVLWTHDTMIPYYTASGHGLRHEALLDGASQQLLTEAEALTAVEGATDLSANYRRVTELANATQQEYQAMLPVRGTHFLIRLESVDSHDVRDEGFSNTEFIITPNAARRHRRIPITAPRTYLGARKVAGRAGGHTFEGSFSDPAWNWSGWRTYPITRHPINSSHGIPGLRSAGLSTELQPSGSYRHVGGITPGRTPILAQVTAWQQRIDDDADARAAAYVAGGMPRGQARNQAKADVENHYVGLGFPHHSYTELKVINGIPGFVNWECHHIHESSWNGGNALGNLIFVSEDNHDPITQWFDRRRDDIRTHLGI